MASRGQDEQDAQDDRDAPDLAMSTHFHHSRHIRMASRGQDGQDAQDDQIVIMRS